MKSALYEGKKITVEELKEICEQNKLKISGKKQELLDRINKEYILPSITTYHGPEQENTHDIRIIRIYDRKNGKEHRFNMPSKQYGSNSYVL